MHKLLKRLGIMLFLVQLLVGFSPAAIYAAENDSVVASVSLDTYTYVNPLYKDVAGEVTSKVPDVLTVAEPTTYYTSAEEVGAVLREAMIMRQETVTIGYQSSQEAGSVPTDSIMAALAHTGDSKAGDYLSYHFVSVYCDGEGYYENGTYYYALNYQVSYYTTAEQEAQVDSAVEALLAELDLADKSDYAKVKAIYDWMCSNITYDYAGLEDATDVLKYTAYGAIVDKNCVCQGYANLFYRLALEAGLDARIISGISSGEAHSWNIVKIAGKYYHLDSTWDAGWAEYIYFLKNTADFTDHTRNEQYLTEEFCAAYPISENSWETGDELFWSANIADGFAGGDGSEASPYLIATPEQLALLAYNVNNCLSNYNQCYYQLTADIDLSEYEWVPIGYYDMATDGLWFVGSFDGNGHTISGMQIYSTEQSYLGLFGVVGESTIKNVTLTDSEINAVSDCLPGMDFVFAGITQVGGLAAEFAGTMENCFVDIDIELETLYTSAEVGGAVGYLVPGASMENVNVTGSIEILSAKGIEAGGVAGQVRGEEGDGIGKTIVQQCSFKGDIVTRNNGNTGDESYEEQGVVFNHATGGLIGSTCYGRVKIADCYTMADIIAESVVYTSPAAMIGDITLIDNNALVLERLYSASTIQYAGDTYSGLLSWLFGSGSFNVNGADISIGSLSECTITIEDCGYFDGALFWKYKDEQEYVGQLYLIPEAFYLDQHTITNLFTTEMSYDESVWAIQDGLYPVFKGQNTSAVKADFGEAAGEILASGECGENLDWTLYKSGVLAISGTGAMQDYTCVYGEEDTYAPWDKLRKWIRKVELDEGITEIGDFAFWECDNIMSMELPSNLTSIGKFAMGSCKMLPQIMIPSKVATISEYAFVYCDSMKEIYIENPECNIFMDGGSIDEHVLIKGKWNSTAQAYAEMFDRAFSAYYTISFDGNGSDSGEMADISGWSGTDAFIPEASFARQGYTFEGWNTTADGTGTTVETGTNIGCEYLASWGENITLYAQWKKNGTEETVKFEDIEAGAYYEAPVQWAVANGITNGYGSTTTFCPELVCTRGQIVTFLWRAKGCPEPASLENPFTDVAADAYYYKAVLWAVEQGITNGYGSDTIFNPDGECTRGQVATFMWRAEGQPANTGNNPFVDLDAGAYYYDAVLWAVEKGVTNGYGSTDTFCPDVACTRGQIVTFLYRGMN